MHIMIIPERKLGFVENSELTAGKIANQFKICNPSISDTLNFLIQAGLVYSVKENQYISCSLNAAVMDEIVTRFIQFNIKC